MTSAGRSARGRALPGRRVLPETAIRLETTHVFVTALDEPTSRRSAQMTSAPNAGVDDPESKAAIARSQDTQGPVAVLRGFTDASWRRLMAVNLDGTFSLLRATARLMVPQGSGRSSR